MPKERIGKFSTKLLSSEGDMHTKVDEEHFVFCCIPRDHRKERQPFLEVPSITLELPGSNTLAHKIKGQFGDKAFTLLEKSVYNFSKPTRLGELKDEVTGEKIHGLTEAQIKLRKQGHYVTTPNFGLGFKLPEPLRTSTKKGK
ncbi:hypothetical protein T459_23497 [Capsicum annuum]|uniref:Uncharacterized protein n=1 Tax=Capsicum annuum TaxID=4072 RepID=A0A2G2YSI9_CAPAN|nr:hypothetical protein T459_23497 [Capsicum annuum]